MTELLDLAPEREGNFYVVPPITPGETYQDNFEVEGVEELIEEMAKRIRE